MSFLNGKKTWIAAIGMAILGISDITESNLDQGIMKIVQALALVGIGHKIEKSSQGN